MTAARGWSPKMRRLRRADEKAQPVPWVEVVSTRFPRSSWNWPEEVRRRSVGLVWSPAVAMVWRRGLVWARVSRACLASCWVVTGSPVMSASSCQLGVSQVILGRRWVRRISRPGGSKRVAPELERMTGSRTIGMCKLRGWI